MTFAVLAASVAGGYAAHRLLPRHGTLDAKIAALAIESEASLERFGSPDPTRPRILDLLRSELANSLPEFASVLDLLPHLARWDRTISSGDIASVLSGRYAPEELSVALDLFELLRTGHSGVRQRLEMQASASEPVRHAAHALGLAAFETDEFHAAHGWFFREGQRPDAVISRRRAVACLVAAEDYDRLLELHAVPAYAELITPSIRLQAAIHARDWKTILRAVPESQVMESKPEMVALALLAGFVWAMVLGQLGGVFRGDTGLTILGGLGVLAGVVSTTPTIYAVIWQDDIMGFSADGDFVRTIVFYIGGVGVREELSKLLLFVPLLPVLLRRDNEREALVVASLVGLGFAIEENGNYFLATGGVSMATRFLTANFLHVALTGLNGLALFRAFGRGSAGWNEFLIVFGSTIIVHGLYDALLSIPEAPVGGYLALALYVLVCQTYFRRAHTLREHGRPLISLTGTFVAGIAVIAGAMIVYQMIRLGPGNGLLAVMSEFIGAIILLVMFIREIDEPLAA